MKISVIGCGYLGAVHAAAMASLGHDVVGVDTDGRKVAALAEGRAPFFEPGLQELLVEGIESGRLTFTTDMSEAGRASVHFLCVGTPQRSDGSAADLTFVDNAFNSLLDVAHTGDIVAGKSTVPVGTASVLARRAAQRDVTLVWNPEFLREGWAVQDTISPDRIVLGVDSPDGQEDTVPVKIMREIYCAALDSGTPLIVTDYATSELVKVAANAFLATKISFINAMAEIAEVTGANVTTLADAIGHDERIGRKFLGAGIGFGGGCLPKDIRAFAARAEELGRADSVQFLRHVDEINLRRRARAVQLVVDGLGGGAYQKKVTVLGASFKPHSDDIRDSPALDVAVQLRGLGADVTVTDPAAIPNARRAFPQMRYVETLDEAVRGADAIFLATEWDEYRRTMEPARVASLVAGRVIVDGRNCLDPEEWRAAGFTYVGMGRR